MADLRWITTPVLVILSVSSAYCGCPALFTDYNMGCYHVGTTSVNSAVEAFETCYRKGGYLLNVNAQLENDYIMDVIAKQPVKFDGYWIGGFYNGKVWMWQKIDPTTGEEVSEFMDPQAGHYQWGPFQPDDGLDPLFAEYYVAIMVGQRALPYKWYSESNDVHTPYGMSYICEANWKE